MTIFGTDDLTIAGLNGLSFTLEGAKAEIERLQHKIDELNRQLHMRGDRVTKRRVRRRLEQFEAELDHLWCVLHPPYSNEGGYVSTTFSPDSLIPCRAAACTNQLTRQLAHSTLGFCPPCWERARNPDRKGQR